MEFIDKKLQRLKYALLEKFLLLFKSLLHNRNTVINSFCLQWAAAMNQSTKYFCQSELEKLDIFAELGLEKIKLDNLNLLKWAKLKLELE